MAKRYRTKFPVGRIKRIMRSDDDVGKVAHVTPVLISKALELFMQNLVTAAADQSRDRGARRMTVIHLRAAVEANERFDFLKPLVDKVAADASGAGIAGAGSGSASSGAAGGGVPSDGPAASDQDAAPLASAAASGPEASPSRPSTPVAAHKRQATVSPSPPPPQYTRSSRSATMARRRADA